MKQPLELLRGSRNPTYLVPFLRVLTVLEGLMQQSDKTYKVLQKDLYMAKRLLIDSASELR